MACARAPTFTGVRESAPRTTTSTRSSPRGFAPSAGSTCATARSRSRRRCPAGTGFGPVRQNRNLNEVCRVLVLSVVFTVENGE